MLSSHKTNLVFYLFFSCFKCLEQLRCKYVSDNSMQYVIDLIRYLFLQTCISGHTHLSTTMPFYNYYRPSVFKISHCRIIAFLQAQSYTWQERPVWFNPNVCLCGSLNWLCSSLCYKTVLLSLYFMLTKDET